MTYALPPPWLAPSSAFVPAPGVEVCSPGGSRQVHARFQISVAK